ncbi:MAG: lysozyme inhibitor LprI family protein [Cyanobacteria bacterium P01_D01_bin.56]
MNKLTYYVVFAGLLLGLVSCVRPDASTESTSADLTEPEVVDLEATPDPVSESSDADASVSQSEDEDPVADAAVAAQPASPPSPVPLAKQDCGALETQQAMNQCVADNYAVADQQLNEVYQQVRQKLNESAQQQLMDAEEQWISFRDAQCAFESKYFEGGSIASLIQSSCLEQLTDNRIAELKQSVKPGISFESADTQLNQVYQRVKASAEDPQGEALTDVQLSWLDYRDSHCEYEATLPVGADIKTCMAAMTETRVWQLEALKKDWSL